MAGTRPTPCGHAGADRSGLVCSGCGTSHGVRERAADHRRAGGAGRRMGSDGAGAAAGVRVASSPARACRSTTCRARRGRSVSRASSAAERGNPEALLVTGPGDAERHHDQSVRRSRLAKTTPIARLTGEPEVIVVPAASPFEIARRSARGVSSVAESAILGRRLGWRHRRSAGSPARRGHRHRTVRVNYIAFRRRRSRRWRRCSADRSRPA